MLFWSIDSVDNLTVKRQDTQKIILAFLYSKPIEPTTKTHYYVTNSYSKIKEILRIEADAITNAASKLDRANAEKTLEILSNCTGKAIIVGVGKSGVIAEKIAQTMTSTGTMAIFVHPTDALHGGLGVVGTIDKISSV